MCLVGQRMLFREGGDTAFDGCDGLVEAVGVDGFEHGIDAGGDLGHIGFHQTAAGHGGGAEADTGRLEGRARLKRHGVFIAGDVSAVERLLGGLGSQLGQVAAQIDQEEVVIRAAGDDFVAELNHGFGQSP